MSSTASWFRSIDFLKLGGIFFVKEDFEQSLKELYMQNCYSLSIEDNQFQKIKVLLSSKQLIQLSQDSKYSELITLTTDGTSALLEIQN